MHKIDLWLPRSLPRTHCPLPELCYSLHRPVSRYPYLLPEFSMVYLATLHGLPKAWQLPCDLWPISLAIVVSTMAIGCVGLPWCNVWPPPSCCSPFFRLWRLPSWRLSMAPSILLSRALNLAGSYCGQVMSTALLFYLVHLLRLVPSSYAAITDPDGPRPFSNSIQLQLQLVSCGPIPPPKTNARCLLFDSQ
jgi:hypothetical protein